jgi:mRNA interferase MazF
MSSLINEPAALAVLARGDIVVIADRYSELAGKPRPAVVVQSAHFATATITVCLITSQPLDAPWLRIALAADQQTGLRMPSWAAIDQLVTIRRTRAARRIGHLDPATMREIGRALVVFLGIGETSRGLPVYAAP